MTITPDELDRRFAYHPPVDDATKAKHETVRRVLKDAAAALIDVTGLDQPSREQSLMVTALEEAMFWANAAIARPPAVP